MFCSAFAFGIFHGNLLQSPYALLMGLILGYVAAEYSVLWAMVLHMINNLLIADILNRLTSGLSEMAAGLIISAVIWAFTIGAVVVLIRNRGKIRNDLAAEKMNGEYLKCYFSCPGMITLTAVMIISMIATSLMMITPL